MPKHEGKRNRCNWCGIKKIELLKEYFAEDVTHYIYTCKACGKPTWRHLVWERCQIGENGAVTNVSK